MSWATPHIEKLRKGESVEFRPNDAGMSPRYKAGQLCVVEPVEAAKIIPGDVVLCRVKGAEFLHVVTQVQGTRYQIGNTRGGIDGWVTAPGIFGKLAKVSD